MAPLSTARTNPPFKYVSRTRSPPCPHLTPCLGHLQSTISCSPSSHSPPPILSHTFLYNPTNPTMMAVSGIRKGFVVVGFWLLTRRCSRYTRRRTILLVG